MARKSRKVSIKEQKFKETDAVQAKQGKKVYRTAAYARLSVEDSKNPGSDTIGKQLSFIKDYIESRPYLELAGEYIDNGVSGVHFDRPGFMDMVADMRAGKIDCIVVKDLSRLGRNYLEAGDYLEKIFPFFGVRFIAVTDGYDSMGGTSADGLVVPLKNLINEAYAKDISKKVSTAIVMKQKQGKFIGNRAPYGYLKSQEDKNLLIVDREVCPIVARIFECKAAGMGNAAIANMLNREGIASPMRYKYEKGITKNERYAGSLWNDGTIATMITNPVYIGDMEQGIHKEAMYMGIKKHGVQKQERIYVKNTHEPVISRELFYRVQQIISEKRQNYLKSREKYKDVERKENPFSRLMFCGDCGGRLDFRRQARTCGETVKVNYGYTCPNSSSYGEHYCKSKYLVLQNLEDAVAESLKLHIKLFLDTKKIIEKLNHSSQAKQIQANYKKQITETRGRLERAQSMGSSLYDDYADGMLNERDYLFAKQKYQKEAEELEQKLSELAAMQDTYKESYTGNQQMAETMEHYAGFEKLTPELVHALIHKIIFFGKDRIEIQYTFSDELKAFVELAEKRKGETICTQEKM